MMVTFTRFKVSYFSQLLKIARYMIHLDQIEYLWEIKSFKRNSNVWYVSKLHTTPQDWDSGYQTYNC